MAQYQRQDDLQWESPLRKVARNSAKRREYTQILKEVQQQRPQTGPLRPVHIEDHIDTPDGWYGYVDALEQQRQQRLKLEAREHANLMSMERERTQKHIMNILSSINPFPQPPRDTGEISLSGIAAQETVPMPAISPERSRETKAPRMPEEVGRFLDHAIRLFVWQYNIPPTHIRLSSYNYRQLALEYNNTILSAYSNQRGTFHLVPDYQLDDTTVICEQHVMQQ